MNVISIGTSGWTYDHWRGVFYPEDIPKTRWLEFYCRAFSTVEVNATFYRHMKPSTVEKWEQNTPEGFCWSIKANRLITHIKRLRDVHEPLKRFLSSVAPLGEKLGPIIFQLPPSLAFDEGLLMTFLSLIPNHFHCALEARNRSWVNERAFSCLHQHKVAWCISDTAGRHPCYEEITADFVYLRLHGSKKLYASSYTEDELAAWAARIKGWERDTYAYFDNDFMGYAPNNALKLKALLGADIPGSSPG
ncbi:MAG: DUF72 domain-containing protein [Desulfomonilia bacterium]|nr:DUF72 domain-containing protein [Desulfomonilia bacterium]